MSDMNINDVYFKKYHGERSWYRGASMIKDVAPILDAYIGLLEAPKYVLFLGLRDEARDKLNAKYPVSLVMSQRQFQREGLGDRYYQRVGVIE